jgi:protease-4
VFIATATLLAAGCTPVAYKIVPVPVDRSLEETVVLDEGGFAPAKIAIVDVDGILMNTPRPQLIGEGEHPVSLFTEKLDKAAKDKAVAAVIIRINTPGGTVTASDIMHHEILYFKQRTDGKKPVVAVMMDLATSGGYYLACACDEIIAHPTTITGSIGVIMQMVNFKGTMQKIGVSAEAIKSGEMKDAGSPLREMRPEERAIFQGLVDNFFDRFVAVVAQGRSKLDEQAVREVADGRVYTAAEALEMGFIDEIGDLRSTLAKLKKQLDLERVRVVTYHRPLGWKPNIYAETPATPQPQVNLININVPETWLPGQPQFLYLWSPGL